MHNVEQLIEVCSCYTFNWAHANLRDCWREKKTTKYVFLFLGAASTARALSSYFDSLLDFTLRDYFTEHFPLHAGMFSAYADPLAMSFCLLITGKSIIKWGIFRKIQYHCLVLLVIGIKESAVLNNLLTAVNLTVICLVIVVGLTKIHGHYWNISPDEVCRSTMKHRCLYL